MNSETNATNNCSAPKLKALEHTISFFMESSEYTLVPVKPYQFDWHLPTKLLLTEQQDPCRNSKKPMLNELGRLSSPTYRAVGSSTSEWCMQLSLTHKEPDETGFLSIYLIFKGFADTENPESSGTKVNVLYSFQIIEENNQFPVFSKGSRIRSFDSASMTSNCFGWNAFCGVTDPMKNRNSNLSVRLNLWILDGSYSASAGPPLSIPVSDLGGDSFTGQNDGDGDNSNVGPTAPRSNEDNKLSRLNETDWQNIIKQLWITKAGSDAELTADDYSFQAHSSVLIARSNLLARELPLCPKNENGMRVYKLDGIGPEVLNSMLEYSYTAETVAFQDFQKTLQLYEAATKLEMKALRCRCVRELVSRLDQLSVSDVASVIKLFDKYPPELSDSKDGLKQLGNYVWKNLLELKKRDELKELLNENEANPTKNNFVQTLLFKSFF